MDNREFIELIKSGNTDAVSHVVRTGQVSLRALEQNMDAPVREVSFLGGLLHGYRRERHAA